jgi:hypothetical protein
MVLTFRSTGVRERVIIDREPDGRQRVARAVQSDYNSRHWDLSLEHPSGESLAETRGVVHLWSTGIETDNQGPAPRSMMAVTS